MLSTAVDVSTRYVVHMVYDFGRTRHAGADMSSIDIGGFCRDLVAVIILGAIVTAGAYAFVHPEPCVHMAHGLVCR
jgi:hypothetical protein